MLETSTSFTTLPRFQRWGALGLSSFRTTIFTMPSLEKALVFDACDTGGSSTNNKRRLRMSPPFQFLLNLFRRPVRAGIPLWPRGDAGVPVAGPFCPARNFVWWLPGSKRPLRRRQFCFASFFLAHWSTRAHLGARGRLPVSLAVSLAQPLILIAPL